MIKTHLISGCCYQLTNNKYSHISSSYITTKNLKVTAYLKYTEHNFSTLTFHKKWQKSDLLSLRTQSLK